MLRKKLKVNNNHTDSNYQRNNGDSDDKLLQEFTPAEFELKSNAEEEEMVFDERNERWD